MFGLIKRFFESSSSQERLVVTKDTLMGDMLDYDAGIADVLMKSGMHCVGCPSSRGEALEIACQVHGMDVDTVINEVNEYIANKHN